MQALFAVAMFLSALLLFSVQPLIAKLVVPLLGGAPSVWNTCMVVFQAALLGGYAYAHAATSWLGTRSQVLLHLVVLSLAFLQLPIHFSAGSDAPLTQGEDPSGWLLGRLVSSLALPLLVVATTAPLLQRWFACTGHPRAGDPYFLYAASNAGSLIGLLAYPLMVEPNIGLGSQCVLWAIGYGLLASLIAGCGGIVWFSKGPAPVSEPPLSSGGHVPIRQRLSWVALSAIPASLLLGVTTYFTTEMAAVPLFWVIPLALYVLSFILVFGRRRLVSPDSWNRALPLLLMALAPALGFGLVKGYWIPVHLAAFFVAALVCHGELVRSRPSPDHLTAFYLAIAVGGVLGGAFNAFLAPRLFNRAAEYPIALVLAGLVNALAANRQGGRSNLPGDLVLPAIVALLALGLMRGVGGVSDSATGAFGIMLACGLAAWICWTHRRRPVRFILMLGAFWMACGLSPGVEGHVIHQERTFFGVLRVTSDGGGLIHRLFHGPTLHGEQRFGKDLEFEPLTYFARTGPLGQVFRSLRERAKPLRVAVAGLGVGSVATYTKPGETLVFYEIDAAVVRIARAPRFFTFLRDCLSGPPEIRVGDARLSLRNAPERFYDVLIIDAFNSDTTPVHLMTREALQVYRRSLKENGLLVFNISNRHFDLDPVIGALARDAGLVCRICYDGQLDPAEIRSGKQPSIWAVMAAQEEDLGSLGTDTRWRLSRVASGETAWTDDYSDLIHYLVIPSLGTWIMPRGPSVQ